MFLYGHLFGIVDFSCRCIYSIRFRLAQILSCFFYSIYRSFGLVRFRKKRLFAIHLKSIKNSNLTNIFMNVLGIRFHLICGFSGLFGFRKFEVIYITFENFYQILPIFSWASDFASLPPMHCFVEDHAPERTSPVFSTVSSVKCFVEVHAPEIASFVLSIVSEFIACGFAAEIFWSIFEKKKQFTPSYVHNVTV